MIDLHLDLSIIRGYPADFYSPTGRPSADPELTIRILLVSYCFGIRSERRLCEEMHLNLAYRWFCRFDLSDHIPDHSTLSKNRHARNRELAMDDHLRPELCCDALNMALGRHSPLPGLIHHSGRGAQYAGREYRALRGSSKIIQSMSRTGEGLEFKLVRASADTPPSTPPPRKRMKP